MNEHSAGRLFIVAAPSGAGKTSLVHRLVCDVPQLHVSISHTTRACRPGEKDGEDYFFVDEACFSDMIAAGAFLEYAQVFGSWYGTSFAQINTRLLQGIDLVLDIDWQGAQQIKRTFVDAVSIFILPPSLPILEQRLISRHQDSADVIAYRMQRATNELSHYHEFDYLVVNDDFNDAVGALEAIVRSDRLRTSRQMMAQQKLLSFLLASK